MTNHLEDLTPGQILDDWTDALESGIYQQGRGWLKKDDKFCCLGVLCDVLVKKGIGSWEPHVVGNASNFVLEDRTATTSLPIPLVDKLGLDLKLPSDRNLEGLLIESNDSEDNPLNFEQIANLLRLTLDS